MPKPYDRNGPVQKRRRIFLLVIACLYTPLFSGAVFGWGPFQLLLEERGSYSHKCHEGYEEICPAQTAALLNVNLVTMLTQLASPFLGWMVDRYGAKLGFYCMTILTWTGLALIMVSINVVDWLLYMGFSLLGMGTWFGGLLIVQTGLLFQGHVRSRVIFLLNSLFDAGAVTYLGLWGLQKVLNNFTLLLGLYLTLAIAIYGAGLYLWTVVVREEDEKPNDAAESEDHQAATTPRLENNANDNDVPEATMTNILMENNEGNSTSQADADQMAPNRIRTKEESTPAPDLTTNVDDSLSANADFLPTYEKPVQKQVLSVPFGLLFTYFVIHVVANQYNLTTCRDFLAYLGDDDYGNKYLTIFTLLTPASIAGVPFLDQILLRYGYHAGFQVVNLLALTYHVVKVASDNLNVQIVGFVAFSFFRCFFFGVTFAFLPKLLSQEAVGKGAGIMYGGAAVFSFVNIPLANVAVERLDGNFFVPNMVHAVLVVPCIYVAWKIGRYNEKVQAYEKQTRLSPFVEAP